MPLLDTLGGLTNKASGFVSNFGIGIKDSFARTTSGTLGNADTGNVWTAVNGTWYSNGGTAVTSTAASSYPYATTPYNQNLSASLNNVSPGGGILFWQTDSNDWWAVTTVGTTGTYYYNYYYYGYYYACQYNSCCTTSYYAGTSNSCCTGSPGSYTYGIYNACCTYTAPSYYAGGYSSCCTTKNTCVASGYCGSSYNACCNGSNKCASSTKCGSSGKYAGVYNACCTGSNNCSSSTHCGAYFSTCCTGSANACVASSTCGAFYSSGVCNPSSSCGAGYTASTCTYSASCGATSNCNSSYCCSVVLAGPSTFGPYTGSGTLYYWGLQILKNIAGSITQVVTQNLSAGYGSTYTINALSVVTSGNTVTATGYSDTAGTTPLGSTLSTTNTGQKGDGTGIIMVPGGYSQGTSVGPFNAK